MKIFAISVMNMLSMGSGGEGVRNINDGIVNKGWGVVSPEIYLRKCNSIY